ncbi:MAG TPA: hypothetical protein VFA24_01790 [Gaiellaceae bacterium]|nr:hypothetical protein [Gaiellaceae bacterium]
MTGTTSIRIATAALISAGALSPVALAGGEPKNDWPFTRGVIERAPALVQASGAQVGLGEPKDQWPFTRAVGGAPTTGAAASLAGEAKNDLPFTQPVATQEIVRSSRFDWGDAAIGAAAGLGLAALVAGGLLVSYRGPRGRRIGAAATR